MNILGIETSCDETSAAVVVDGKVILSNVISSQIDIHRATGGVVPEVASRSHLEKINLVIDEAIASASITLLDLHAVAVTNRPGLIGALLVGVSAAKAMGFALKIPVVPIHHIEAHIYANWLSDLEPTLPLVCLVVSGGHTEIFHMTGHGTYNVLGRTRDDAAGEAFDKSARLLGLPYPGGIEIDRLSRKGDPRRVTLPRTQFGSDSLDFSFSGLKSAVIQATARQKNASVSLEDWCASIQQAIVEILVDNTVRAAVLTGAKTVAIAGGVAANHLLQTTLSVECARRDIAFSCPPSILCTDNAAMIACAAHYALLNKTHFDRDFDTYSSERLA